MNLGLIELVAFAVAAIVLFMVGRSRAAMLAGDRSATMHSTPPYHGSYLAIVTLLPAFLVWIVWLMVSETAANFVVTRGLGSAYDQLGETDRNTLLRLARAVADGSAAAANDIEARAAEIFSRFDTISTWIIVVAIAALIGGGLVIGYRSLSTRFRARHAVERTAMGLLIAASSVAIVTTLGIVLSLIFESLRFFEKVPFFQFLFGLHWSPQSAYEGAGEVATQNADVFGAVPVFAGTLLITAIAMLVAAPIGLLSAIYLSEYAGPRVRSFAKPLLEVLAGIPTVVYGFFAALTVAPLFRGLGATIGLGVSSESALAAGLIMGVMIIPFVSSLSDDVINAVPQSLRDGSAGLGATKSETIRKVIIPAALPGIVSALMLAISRAIGETMIVVMAAGLAANLTANPLDAVTTVTVQIVTLLVGDQEFDSAKTLAAFALGLVLFIVTLLLNIVALRIVKKYREAYE
jgi:phosphate transport system permease protein